MDSSWVAQRLPSVPTVLAEVLAEAAEGGSDPAQCAISLLDAAVTHSESREGAWPLLGADALISYICEQALDMDERPERSFSQVFHLCAGDL